MPSAVELLRVFVASPSDVEDERAAVEAIISELNKTVPTDYGVRLEVVRSETDIHPAVGLDPQDVINTQIGDNYDLFVGIMWTRFGTPTLRAGSGTEEEFNRAYSRLLESPHDVSIMLYFKDAAIAPSKIDFAQATKVQCFRERVSSHSYYQAFNDVEEFAKYLRLHLSLWLKQRHDSGRLRRLTAMHAHTIHPQPAQEEETELGLFDYLELFEESTERLNAFAAESAEILDLLARRITKRAAELQTCRQADGSADFKQAKKISNKAAEDYKIFATELDSKLEVFSSSYANAIAAMEGIVALSHEFESPTSEEKLRLSDQIDNLVTTLQGAKKNLSEMKQSADSIPRMTSDFNRSKRMGRRVLERATQEFDKAASLFIELGAALRKL